MSIIWVNFGPHSTRTRDGSDAGVVHGYLRTVCVDKSVSVMNDTRNTPSHTGHAVVAGRVAGRHVRNAKSCTAEILQYVQYRIPGTRTGYSILYTVYNITEELKKPASAKYTKPNGTTTRTAPPPRHGPRGHAEYHHGFEHCILIYDLNLRV